MKKTLLTTLVLLTAILLFSSSMVCAQVAPVAKTGQTTCYDTSGTEISCAGTGQDGNFQKGIASPNPRFTDNGDETITDNLTGLMWTKDSNLGGTMTWQEALDYANNLILGNEGCGTSYTDWRLPNVKELQTLIDFANYGPAVPTGHPFINVQTMFYWSSTTCAVPTSTAWIIYMNNGITYSQYAKTNSYYVWPVRSDN